MTALYLGIDGGGTKTQATILDDTGQIRGIGVAGASNFGNSSVDQAIESIHTAIQLAATDADCTEAKFDAAFLGIAGVVSEADRQVVHKMAQQLDLAPANKIGADHDCRIALAGGLAGEPGIVQIIGTGTSCFGMNAAGERWMAGGWGYLIADDGGGYWLGIQAMRVAVAAYDGRGEPTQLLDMVIRELGIGEIPNIMQRLYSAKITVTEIAALSRMVVKAAEQNDPIACAIIAKGMDEVARGVEAVARKLRFGDDVRLICIGGMMSAGSTITKPLTDAVQSRLPRCRIEPSQFSASVGAALLAREIGYGTIDPGFLETLKSSLQQRQ